MEITELLNGSEGYGYKAELRGTNGWVKVCPTRDPKSRETGEPLVGPGRCSSIRVKNGAVVQKE